MKIAVPTTSDGMIDSHFGHCDYFSIYAADENNNITCVEVLRAPEQCGCKSGIAFELRQKGVMVMLAGSMGPGAVNVLNNNGIKVVRGCTGSAPEAIKLYLSGHLYDSGEACSVHGTDDHSCNHH